MRTTTIIPGCYLNSDPEIRHTCGARVEGARVGAVGPGSAFLVLPATDRATARRVTMEPATTRERSLLDRRAGGALGQADEQMTGAPDTEESDTSKICDICQRMLVFICTSRNRVGRGECHSCKNPLTESSWCCIVCSTSYCPVCRPHDHQYGHPLVHLLL